MSSDMWKSIRKAHNDLSVKATKQYFDLSESILCAAETEIHFYICNGLKMQNFQSCYTLSCLPEPAVTISTILKELRNLDVLKSSDRIKTV